MVNNIFLWGSKSYALLINEIIKNYKKNLNFNYLKKNNKNLKIKTVFDPYAQKSKYKLQGSFFCNVKNFMAVLSTCIYPEKAIKYPMTEEQLYDGPPPKQNFSYAYAKRCLAVQIDSYKFQYNKSNWCYVIPCNLYGEDDKFDFERAHFVSALIEKIFNSNGEIKLLGTGASLRQFMYAGDLALAIKKLVEKNIYDNFNIANDEILSIKDIALLSLKTLNKQDIKITFSGNKEEDGNYRKDVSSKKLLEVLDNFTFTPLSTGIKKVYKIYRERNE